MERYLELRLERKKGPAQSFDLTALLPGASKWELRGYKIAVTDEVEIYYSLDSRSFVLIVKELAGAPNRSWYLPYLEDVIARAAEFITPLDLQRVKFVLTPYLPDASGLVPG